ncbi:SusC/RagA family TonB-linked outer membrane protein [Deminuibacter soli]|uniref:SusC/RagA family TonB-linked outer membrane protein n=1 Tax=Deminuibacter soli TaxID=2291815 RepID=A0A3E1NDR4_9BACT|nr:SusC/RagA family TonB-linked outer membrane protein [Deminuibacter soli]RFM25984.1 SusC/RagA family TonB-linked outer membrane protein [Deminuibacter soli]
MRKLLLIFPVLLWCIITATGQTGTVTGKVQDKTGKPVEGASVQVKGTSKGTTTTESGTFFINAKVGDVLLITGVNYHAQQVRISNLSSSIDVSLDSVANVMQEVVVTALGQSRSKAKLGYTATTVTSDVLNRDAPVNLLDGVQGRIAGANISNVGGPGTSTKVVLRGYSVIGGGSSNQPLYVIDGVPLSDASPSAQTNGTSNTDFGNGMTNINPNDIESITVLKGTAAASLYGSTAKNGAIMITTKRGKAGKLRVDYSGGYNLSKVGKLPEMQNEFGQGWGGQFILSENGSWGPRLDGKMRPWGATVDNSQLIKPFSFVKNNIRDFYNTGTELTNSIALSGGTDINRFYFSYGNVFSDGVLPTKADYLERHTFALRTNSNYGKFSINTSFNYINRKQNAPFTGQGGSDGQSTFEALLQIPVDIPIKDFSAYNNKFFNVDNYFTPYAENPYYPLNENGNVQKLDRFFGSLDMNYKFTDYLSLQYRLGGDFTNARTLGFKQPNKPSPDSWNDGNNVESATRKEDFGSVSQASDYYGIINMDLILKYNQDLNKDLNLEVIGGANYYQSNQRNEFAQVTNLVIPGFFNLSNSKLPPVVSDFNSLRRRVGLYAQATLGYKNQLFLSGNVRNDWSSTLPINKNSIFYPGGNLAWVASQTFDMTHSPVSFLKFRVGYGKTGSDAEPYQVYPVLTAGTPTAPLVGLPFGSITSPFNGVSAFRIANTIGNPALKPVITKELEAGLEARLFKNRIGIDATYYNKRTDGQILVVPIAPGSGYTGLVQNLGLITNKGVELALDVKPVVSKNFNWSMTYTYTKNWNKVNNLNGGPSNVILNTAYDAEIRAVPGQPVAEMYALVPATTPDGKIIVDSKGLPTAAQQKGDFGSTQYNYMMGLVNTFSYKNWTLNASLDFRFGGVMYSGTSDLLLFVGNGRLTTFNDRNAFVVPNSVQVTGTDASGKDVYATNSTAITSDNFYSYFYPTTNPGSSYYQRIISKSFLKLRDVTLSYKLPQHWASKIASSGLSVGAYARNLLLWTPKSNLYLDPEAGNLGNDLTSELGEFRAAPVSIQVGLLLRASF